jgi:hypothetical protein
MAMGIKKIRLIPKKGDLTKIGNWRPISLLNCFYKLISRVFTNRLKKVIDKITRVGQYGYSARKQCQEVLLGIIKNIHETKKQQLRGALISLDIKKAFDSISHDFLSEALKFFGFGNTFITWIKLLCTGRNACIIFKENKLGKKFTLERGNAQGDTISPFLFNICYQILLLKLEYDLQIDSVFPENRLPVPAAGLAAAELGTTIPVSAHSKKVFAFADDCNLICKLNNNSLRRLKIILDEFENLSGLECNTEKTNLIRLGDPAPDPTVVPELEEIETDFKIVQSMRILGMKMSNNTKDDVKSNAEFITRKIIDQISLWSRFNLSLPGRIAIAKTMLYSQVNYLGCFLPFEKQTISHWEDIIRKFVSGNLNVSAKRCYLPAAEGGLGLVPVNVHLNAQRCRWVLLCKDNIDSDWKLHLNKFMVTSAYRYFIPEQNRDEIDIALHCVLDAFDSFKKKFFNTGNNYRKMCMYLEKHLPVGVRSTTYLMPDDINNIENVRIRNKIINLHVFEVLDPDNNVKNRTDCGTLIGMQINTALYNKIRNIVNTANTKFRKEIPEKGVSLETFFDGWKKGSKKIRNIMWKSQTLYVPHNLVKFAENTNTVITAVCSEKLNSQWTCNFLSNELRTMLFKLHSNCLPVNTIVSHFKRGVSRNCTFCELIHNPDPEDESIFHLFFACPAVEAIREDFFTWLSRDENFLLSRHEFFCCFTRQENSINSVDIIEVIVKLFKQFLWECKTRKILPVPLELKKFIKRELEIICNISKNFKKKFDISNYRVLFNEVQF